MATASWPALPYEEWKDTYATLHMWTQVVGKVALAHAPPLNHSWAIALHVTPRGLATRTLRHGERSFTLEFDFLDHALAIRASDGAEGEVALAPQSVSDFHRAVMARLSHMGLPVAIWPMPVEIDSPIRFDRDTVHHTYVPEHAQRCWRVLVEVERVLTSARCAFVGKSSPAHFFWGAFDLALTRFSGRLAPPREGPAFMREAYSHEVISHGFWPGNAAMPEAVFYAYAVPEPTGFRDTTIRPARAAWHRELAEFVLPYEAVRTAASPERALIEFVDSTYEAGAMLGGWDRATLERATHEV